VLQFGLDEGRMAHTHRWLAEGFAEWVSFKVVDILGAKNFFHDHIRQACHEKINLRELNALESWLEPKHSGSLYGPSACAVHYMTVKDGVPPILEYFRLFKNRENAAKNFATAFGESSFTFEQEVRTQAESTVDLSP